MTTESETITKYQRYYLLHREQKLAELSEKYNTNPEVLRKRLEREHKKVEKEAEKEAKRAEKEAKRAEKTALAYATIKGQSNVSSSS